MCRDYLDHIEVCEYDPKEASVHDQYISSVIEQFVRKEAFGTSQQGAVSRFIENLLLGDARRRGETHQWAYERISLPALLRTLGLKEITIESFNTSSISGWEAYRLDADDSNNEYKLGSLYVEAKKPSKDLHNSIGREN